ncbi:crotonase/enoyl-CoA hydratase family protein [Rhizorhabdus dicambivorans]|uniref:Enoyl-CoA hydratase n=1 Tax=Rhizorhabdus dicambivorans TaxID=1850238 RepID=A0A2A4FVQ6_9SPHN|nr:crotonase/enoyl-CoA hydratase family protein [Rhizorhabdus dicambivorans]ATE64199.1 enoyl-CoA hydratase [Rhizorhabdus dicambivorans]PCE42529.1 enoyl-CoA hydratase [Rhizorhabdus dicambivorans]
MNDRITVDIRAGVADVRLNRPDKLNALDDAMFDAVIRTGERLAQEKTVRAVVLSGEGRAFCAGLDMSNFTDMAGDEPPSDRLFGKTRSSSGANRAQQMAMTWRDLPMPVIASIHGAAFGGGLQIALGCDIRFATPDARLSVMEIRWGLIPDMGGMALLRNLVRDDVARELTWTGRQVSGEEAAGLGLVTRLSANPHEAAMALATEIAAKSPNAVRSGKRLLNLAADGDQRNILLLETEEQLTLMGRANQREALQANLEKREPSFRD